MFLLDDHHFELANDIERLINEFSETLTDIQSVDTTYTIISLYKENKTVDDTVLNVRLYIEKYYPDINKFALVEFLNSLRVMMYVFRNVRITDFINDQKNNGVINALQQKA